MNIVLRTYSGHYIVRPDTSWKKNNDDVYLPDFARQISWVPILFVKMSRPAKSVSARFASRYFDSFNYGFLIYPDELMDGSPEGFACASCMDGTSFFPLPLHEPSRMGEMEFVLSRGGEEIFRSSEGTRTMVEEAISEASRRIFLRMGDFLAIELRDRQPLMSLEDSRIHMEGKLSGEFLLGFDIISA